MGYTTGELIRRERLARDQSQSDVAEALGVAKSAVCQWELGVYEPSLEALRALGSFWGLPLQYIVGTRAGARASKHTRPGRKKLRLKVSAELNHDKRGSDA